MTDPNVELLTQSIKWRTAAGWLLVAVLAWRYLVHPITSAILVSYYGDAALPPLDDLSIADVLAVIGLPVGGAIADRMSP